MHTYCVLVLQSQTKGHFTYVTVSKSNLDAHTTTELSQSRFKLNSMHTKKWIVHAHQVRYAGAHVKTYIFPVVHIHHISVMRSYEEATEMHTGWTGNETRVLIYEGSFVSKIAC